MISEFFNIIRNEQSSSITYVLARPSVLSLPARLEWLIVLLA